MRKCFLIVATGKAQYYQMALNLCLSIKANGNWPVHLIYSGDGATEAIGTRIKWFNITYYQPAKYANHAQEAFWLKLNLYNIVHALSFFENYDEFILLDADTMVLPGKDLNDWWEQNKIGGHETWITSYFSAYANNGYDYRNGQFKRPDANFWCDPVEAQEYFKIPKYSLMPQINASFIYFRKSEKAKEIFDRALFVWQDNNFPVKMYRGTKTEEVCFNIACAQSGVVPCFNIPYRPLYMQVYSEQRDETYIQHRFNAFSMAGHINHDQRIVSLYNKLSDYYRGLYGIADKFHFNQEMKIMKEQRPIYGFWHICAIGNWHEVVKEQLKMLRTSGLYDNSKIIYACIVLEEYQDLLRLIKLLKNHLPPNHKVIVVNGGKVNKFEFPTLSLLKLKTRQEEPFFGYYIHTKGVSDPRGKHWRDFLNYYNITKWREAQGKLRIGHDLCGVKLIENNPAHPMHYSGNFWHFDSEYIKTLKPIESLDHSNRFNAEMWVCSGQPNAATLSQVQIDHFQKPKFKESASDRFASFLNRHFLKLIILLLIVNLIKLVSRWL